MPGFMSRSHSEELDFELFSNIILKFTAILMVVLVLLAINVGQKLDQIISPYRFSGGLARPQLHLAVNATENHYDDRTMMVGLFSTSYAEAQTYVDAITRETVAKNETVTFSGRYFSTPYLALALLAGISPGAIPIDGKQTPFVVPRFSSKNLVFFDKANNRENVPPSEKLARSFLKIWSDTFSNPVYPIRAFSEYKNVKARIYVETGPHNFIIGNQIVTPEQIKTGRLDFLTSLSSTNTEIVYLGDFNDEPSEKRNSRLDFWDQNGFADAAKHYRSRLFPGTDDLDRAKDYSKLLTGWDQLSANEKSIWLNGANGDANLAREHYERSTARRATANYRNSLVEDAMKKDAVPDAYALPTILAYPDAWQAYVDYRTKAEPTPPERFVTEFLQPLGFDKRVVVLEE